MKIINFKAVIAIMAASLVLSSCDNSTKNMRSIPIEVFFDRGITSVSNEPLPTVLKELMQPFEVPQSKEVFVPQVTYHRLDLNKDSVSLFEMPVEPANKLRKLTGTYDYGNLISDYKEYTPTLTAGVYLSKEGMPGAVRTFELPSNDDSIHLSLDMNEAEVRIRIKQHLEKKTPSRLFVLFRNDSVSHTVSNDQPTSLNSAAVGSKVVRSSVTSSTITTTTTKAVTSSEFKKVRKAIHFDDGVYVGTVNRENLPCDQFGRKTFSRKTVIDLNDREGRTAEPGDYVIGVWYNGHLSHGKWFSKNSELKGVLMIGADGNCD